MLHITNETSFKYNGEEVIIVDDEALKLKEKQIVSDEFKKYVSEHSFNSVCMKPLWEAPRIGMHEDGYLTVFHDEKPVSFKRFINEKLSESQKDTYSEEFKSEVSKMNLFLCKIAINKGLEDVKGIKEAMNRMNDECLGIHLVCNDSNDEEYTLSVTNRMVRVRLVDKAKANKAGDNFQTLKFTDFVEVIMAGLSAEYLSRQNG